MVPPFHTFIHPPASGFSNFGLLEANLSDLNSLITCYQRILNQRVFYCQYD